MVTVQAITAFQSHPEKVNLGESVLLSWNTERATKCELIADEICIDENATLTTAAYPVGPTDRLNVGHIEYKQGKPTGHGLV